MTPRLIPALIIALGSLLLQTAPAFSQTPQELAREGLFAKHAGDLAKAEESLRAALAGLQGTEGFSTEAHLYMREALADVLSDRGQLAEAVELYQQNLADTEKVPDMPASMFINSLGKYAIALHAIGRKDEALTIFEQVYDMHVENSGARSWESAVALGNLAGALHDSGDTSEALALQKQVIKSLSALLEPTDPVLISARATLATFFSDAGLLEEADRQYRTARTLAERELADNHPISLYLRSFHAILLMNMGRDEEALTTLRDHLEDITSQFGPDANISRASLGVYAQLAMSEGDVLNGLPILTFLMMSEIADLGATGHQDVDTPFPLDYSAWMVDRAVSVALQNYGYELSFVNAGFAAAQAGALIGTGLAATRASALAAAEDVGLQQLALDIERLNAEIDAIGAEMSRYSSYLNQTTPHRLGVLVERRATLKAEVAELDMQLAEHFPDFVELSSPWPVTVEELQGHGGLGPQDVLIVLTPNVDAFEPDGHGRVWAVSADEVAWADIPMSEAGLAAAVGQFHAQLAAPSGSQPAGDGQRAPLNPGAIATGATPRAFDGALAHTLYIALFGDAEVAAILEQKDNWMIAPQGSLFSLPFAALLTEPPNTALITAEQLRAAPWLGMERNLTILPSASAFRQLNREPAASAGGDGLAYLGLGDPVFDAARLGADASSTAVRSEQTALGSLAALPGTRREVEALASLFDGNAQILLGAAATVPNLEQMVTSRSLSSDGILHLATHGLLTNDLPGLDEPALALTPVDGQSGLLKASDISAMQLRTSWVILSACNTAGSAKPGAEGLSGLARAFFYAGARSLLVSHWSVRDDIAATLIQDTVTQTQVSGLSRAGALRQAMANIIADTSRDHTAIPFSHPASWAVFEVVGAR